MTRLCGAIAAMFIVAPHPALSATAVLRSADARIIITSRTSCDVRLAVTVEGAREIEHRLAVADGHARPVVNVEGAEVVDSIHDLGATLSLRLRPAGESYLLHYSVEHPVDRCPLWLPTIPTDGRSRAVRITIELPAGSTAGARGTTLPALNWNGTTGTAALNHLPSMVHVPYAAPGQAVPWTLPGAVDTLAIGTFAAATAVWIWRVRR
jgi:hypothetical protein